MGILTAITTLESKLVVSTKSVRMDYALPLRNSWESYCVKINVSYSFTCNKENLETSSMSNNVGVSE